MRARRTRRRGGVSWITPGLVRELMSNYGRIDILWYDVSWPLQPARSGKATR